MGELFCLRGWGSRRRGLKREETLSKNHPSGRERGPGTYDLQVTPGKGRLQVRTVDLKGDQSAWPGGFAATFSEECRRGAGRLDSTKAAVCPGETGAESVREWSP